MNVFFDVDQTIIDTQNGLRPGVIELFTRLRAEGHVIYLWSGIGKRWEIVERYALAEFVADCFEKPLMQYERLLGPLGITVRPDFVVDDHPHLVHHFGGFTVKRYLRADAHDTEMGRVYDAISAATKNRAGVFVPGSSAPRSPSPATSGEGVGG